MIELIGVAVSTSHSGLLPQEILPVLGSHETGELHHRLRPTNAYAVAVARSALRKLS